MQIYSNNRQLTYVDGMPLHQCGVCREEHTDIAWGYMGLPPMGESGMLVPICIYCAFARKEGFRPSQELGQISTQSPRR